MTHCHAAEKAETEKRRHEQQELVDHSLPKEDDDARSKSKNRDRKTEYSHEPISCQPDPARRADNRECDQDKQKRRDVPNEQHEKRQRGEQGNHQCCPRSQASTRLSIHVPSSSAVDSRGETRAIDTSPAAALD